MQYNIPRLYLLPSPELWATILAETSTRVLKKTVMNKDWEMGVVKKKSKKKTNVEEKVQRKCNKLFKYIRGYSTKLSSSCFWTFLKASVREGQSCNLTEFNRGSDEDKRRRK